ncbi:Hypothetical predicted protein [Octopus vulgaris]|uniref:Uncharacterized protein n=1 Tax=Octopus vulgaris TaxID=6645 RepID=A0AA36F2S3_OCTVU|nr:Hypothetical predicted protein [Octopus vulgaris]
MDISYETPMKKVTSLLFIIFCDGEYLEKSYLINISTFDDNDYDDYFRQGNNIAIDNIEVKYVYNEVRICGDCAHNARFVAVGRPSQERHTANSYSIWRTRNQDSRPYLDENKLANVRKDILRNNRLAGSEISAIKHATENDINIRHKGNEESDEQYSPPRGLIERLPSDQSTQRPEDTRNSIEPVKDSQENDKTTVTEDLAFAEEHR